MSTSGDCEPDLVAPRTRCFAASRPGKHPAADLQAHASLLYLARCMHIQLALGGRQI